MRSAVARRTAVHTGTVSQTARTITVRGDTYAVLIEKTRFRYSVLDAAGAVLAPPHPVSGLRVAREGAGFADAATAVLVSSARAATAVVRVTLTDGTRLDVRVRPDARTVRFSTSRVAGTATIDFRTGPVAPAYGLGDYGAFADGQPEQRTPCSGEVAVRPTTELTGIVLDNLTNQGSCKRFITNFTVFPRQRLAQVLFFEGRKRVALTADENRLGVGGTRSVDGLFYLVAEDLRQLYRDYKDLREAHGYVDARPDARMFGLGWEAYGALGWNTYQASVEETVQAFVDHGYPLSWGVVGSGFWPGPRGGAAEGTTNSFGTWDDTPEPGRVDSQPGLPNPRYPDPDHLKGVFARHGIALLLGARTNVTALPEDGGNHDPAYDGDFLMEAIERGYLLTGPDGAPAVVTRAQFPSGASYVLDASDPDAVRWFVEQMRKWGVQGWKEDTMLYEPDTHRDGNWNPLVLALHDAGDLVMVRNAAYSVPGDSLRLNDTMCGAGTDFHGNPDRIPVQLLNYAASGAGNVYGDYVGGTPGHGSMADEAYMRYFVRNAQLAALTPVLAFGLGPWELGRADYADGVKALALWHESVRPYVYSAVLDGYETGYPTAMTPLPVAYPDDPATYALANDTTRQYEWMFGESILATPVWGADFATATSRDVYLPAGTWIDIATGAVFTGPRTLEGYAIGPDRVPAFVGGKGVLVTRDPGSGGAAGLTVAVYPVAAGSEYRWTDGTSSSTVTSSNTGWDPASLTVADLTARRDVAFDVDDVTGAVRFPLVPGHDYALRGGG
ncbi:hypothetical protein [Xylanimonas sp. McL0601]|uniref:hypothetical protein n=1 Tax=Xylanimonas sp. McL0601 TaxID=3414739 RepID=UPI003CE71577